jgi:diadenosine tetraphosphatase ApaH/serine/threonine PP2A family protein phosphatase
VPTFAIQSIISISFGAFVRILLLSDIHSNLEALEACLSFAPPYDRVVNLGDLVGYGGSPNEVIERSKNLGNWFVRGNHDKAAAGLMELADFNPIAGLAALWTREHLTPENLEWLRTLPQGPIRFDEVPDAQFVHGSPMGEDEYVVTLRDALEPLLAFSVPLTFFGHTHLQGGFSLNASASDAFRPAYRSLGRAESCEWALGKEQHYLINPGSVGQPRDGDWRAAFAVFDSDARIVSFHRTPYNLKQAQERILAANLPQRLASRLAAGR